MSLIQLLLLIFFLFAIFKVVGRYRAQELSKRGAFFWIALWVVAGVVVVVPDITFSAARLAGVGRGADLVVYVGLAALFFVVFRLMVKANRQEQAITRLTREIALRDEAKK